jgi:hypothetical protein
MSASVSAVLKREHGGSQGDAREHGVQNAGRDGYDQRRNGVVGETFVIFRTNTRYLLRNRRRANCLNSGYRILGGRENRRE